ncbi:hypothetical protein OEZ85_012282 [Tetradesmus obliquus]|uniref:Uncharacterized protein n=1 Tax=Tetradesmus obliquus TaxID=3088 RepID=A0ABY8TXL9_TETOB|nr:hypothetical protein OEZ85_012282 [Tetradesmus obliquus]
MMSQPHHQRFVDSCTLGEQAPALKMAGALMLAEDVSAAEVSCLPQLQLQRLTIGGPGLDESTAEHVLANMTGLRSLRISAAPRFTCKGLLHLTRLEQLSEIIVDGCNTVYAYGANGAMAAACARLGIQHDEIGDVRNAQQHDFLMSYRDYYRGHGSEVWQRLRKLCDKSPQCQ